MSGDAISVMHTAPVDPVLFLSIDFVWQPISSLLKSQFSDIDGQQTVSIFQQVSKTHVRRH